MPNYQVLITDYAWPDLEIEREILARVGAEVILPPDTTPATLARVAAPVDAIMTNWAKVPADVIAAATNCKIVARLGIGLDNIDVAACTARKIPVTNVPDYCLIEVAEHTLALVFGLARKIGWYHQATQSGTYQLQSGPTMFRMQGQTLGLIGYGNIGQLVAEKALALGLKVLVCNRSVKPAPAGVTFVALDELLQASDYISLHVPMSPETKHLLNATAFAKMKPTAYVINTSRGGLIDHAALAAALEKGQLAGAGLDVQDPEPPNLGQAPYNDPRVIVTPHAAFVSQESLENLRRRAAQQVADQLTGKQPENVRNGM
jgi:D-3-phosphoglycerate dehydrogenase